MEFLQTVSLGFANVIVVLIGVGIVRRVTNWAMADLGDEEETCDDDEDGETEEETQTNTAGAV